MQRYTALSSWKVTCIVLIHLCHLPAVIDDQCMWANATLMKASQALAYTLHQTAEVCQAHNTITLSPHRRIAPGIAHGSMSYLCTDATVERIPCAPAKTIHTVWKILFSAWPSIA